MEKIVSLERDSLIEGMSDTLLRSVYYVAGWTLFVTQKMAHCRKRMMGESVHQFVDYCSFRMKEKELGSGLPIRKIVWVEAFNGMTYPISAYFEFVFKLDQVFTSSLSEELFILNGSRLILLIETVLQKNKCLIDYFKSCCPIDFDTETFDVVYHFYSSYSFPNERKRSLIFFGLEESIPKKNYEG